MQQPGVQLPFGINVTDNTPTDVRYWAEVEAQLNSGYTHAGMFRFIPEGAEKDRLYIKLSNGWHRMPLFTQKGDAGTLEIIQVVTGDEAKVEDLSQDPSKAQLKITLPRGLPGAAATLSISKITALPSGSPARIIEKGTPASRVYELEIPRGDTGLKGDKGDSFKIDGIGTFAERSNYNPAGFGAGTSYLVVDETDPENNGFMFFKKADNTWTTGVGFTGLRGWSPVLAAVDVNATTTVHAVVDWIGGQGEKPEIPDNGYYIGPDGYTLDPAEAFNIRGVKGEKGDQGDPFKIDAQGTLAGRSAHDAAMAPFVYYDNVNGNIYFKLADNNWSPAYKFKGEKGQAGNTGWLAFAEDANGLNPAKTPAGKNFVAVHYALTYPADLSVFVNWQQLGTGGASDHNNLTGVDTATATTVLDVSDDKSWHLGSALLQDIKNSVYPNTAPTATIGVTPSSAREFNEINTPFQIDAFGESTNVLATVASVVIDVSRDNATWTTLKTDSGLNVASHTITDHPYTSNTGGPNNNQLIFRVTVTDSVGTIGQATQTVTFKNYVNPTTSVTSNLQSFQQVGKDDFLLSAATNRNSPLVPLSNLSIEKSEDNGVWMEVATNAISATGGNIAGAAVTVTPGTLSVRFRSKAVDSQGITYSPITTVNFRHKFYYGFNVNPMIVAADVLNLAGFLADDATQDFTLPVNNTLRYPYIVFENGNGYPTIVRDLTNSNTDYPVSANEGVGDYFQMGTITGPNEEGYITTWKVLRSKNATSGYGGTNLRTI